MLGKCGGGVTGTRFRPSAIQARFRCFGCPGRALPSTRPGPAANTNNSITTTNYYY